MKLFAPLFCVGRWLRPERLARAAAVHPAPRRGILGLACGAASLLLACPEAAAAGDAPREPPRAERPPAVVTLAGATYRIPRDYVVLVFPGERGGFDLSLLAATLEPYTRRTAPDFPRDFLRAGVTVLGMMPPPILTAERAVSNLVNGRTLSWVEPAEEPAERLGGPGEPPVPAGLVLRRALPAPPPCPGCPPRTRVDRLVPAEPRRGPDGEALPEAIFCSSPLTALVIVGAQRLDNLRCEHVLPFRGLELRLRYNREHLPRWREIRDGALALLNSFVVADAADSATSPSR